MASVPEFNRVAHERRFWEDSPDSGRTAYGAAGNSALADAHGLSCRTDHVDRPLNSRWRLAVANNSARWQSTAQ